MYLINKLSLLLFLSVLLAGCQSIGDHLNCQAEVDRTVPAQTQQRYLRTDTRCSSSGGGIASPTTTRGDQYIVNASGQTNCTSTPVYETIILNQSERNAAMSQCKYRVSGERAQQQYYQQQVDANKTYYDGVTRGAYPQQQAESVCRKANSKDSAEAIQRCVDTLMKTTTLKK